MEDSNFISFEKWKINLWQALTFILIGLIAGFVFGRHDLSLMYGKANITESKIGVTNTNEEGVVKNPLKIDLSRGISVGSEKARVVLINFGDYECVFGREFYLNILPKLTEEFIDSGKVRYIYRDFPLAIHSKALPAAHAARCAGEQNRYWDMHNMLFEKQPEWKISKDYMNLFTEYAGLIGINTTAFNDCMEARAYEKDISKDKTDGELYEIKGTPSLIINGELLRTVPKTYDQLKHKIWKILI